MPSSAAMENHAKLYCPRGTMKKAANSGPSAEPVFPPTWKRDCASPCCPPEAMRATRADSGWNTEDPTPTSAAENKSALKLDARDRPTSPTSVDAIPTGKENGQGRRSVQNPTHGCRNDAVSW